MLAVIQLKTDVYVSQNNPLIFKQQDEKAGNFSHLTTELFPGQNSQFLIMSLSFIVIL